MSDPWGNSNQPSDWGTGSPHGWENQPSDWGTGNPYGYGNESAGYGRDGDAGRSSRDPWSSDHYRTDSTNQGKGSGRQASADTSCTSLLIMAGIVFFAGAFAWEWVSSKLLGTSFGSGGPGAAITGFVALFLAWKYDLFRLLDG